MVGFQPGQVPEEDLASAAAEGQDGVLVRGAGEEGEAGEHDVRVRDGEVQEARPGFFGGGEGGAGGGLAVVDGGGGQGVGRGVAGGEAVDGPEGYVLFAVGFGEDKVVVEPDAGMC